MAVYACVSMRALTYKGACGGQRLMLKQGIYNFPFLLHLLASVSLVTVTTSHLALELQVHVATMPAFTGVLRMHTQILTLTRQVLYPLNNLHSPRTSSNILRSEKLTDV